MRNQEHHVEMASLESGAWPMPFDEVGHAFLAIGDHDFWRGKARKKQRPGTIAFGISELPEDFVFLGNGDERAKHATMDELRVYDEALRLKALRCHAIRILFEKWTEFFPEPLPRYAKSFRNG